MNDKRPVGIDFERILETLSKQIYDTPMAFLRENVQNAIDAIRMDNVENPSSNAKVQINIQDRFVRIHDSGIGMSEDELVNFFWTMGASGKNSPLGRKAGCIGTFGIGAFANFGVCDELVVISKKRNERGTRTSLAKRDIQPKGVPEVTYTPCEDAAPHGTIVEATLANPTDSNQLLEYLRPVVAYAPEAIFFGTEEISRDRFTPRNFASQFTPLSNDYDRVVVDGSVEVSARFFRDNADSLHVHVGEGWENGEALHCSAILHLQHGALEVYKRGFKLCNISATSAIGFSGRLDVDILRPTAGRDSLDAPSQQFTQRLFNALEKRAVHWILTSSALLAHHTRVLRYVLNHGLVKELGMMNVSLADGSTEQLSAVERFWEDGGKVYFGHRVHQELLDVLHAAGHKIVIFSVDRDRQRAELTYLQNFCGAQSYENLFQIKEFYSDLTRFEVVFLGYLEAAIQNRYEVFDFEIVAASITGGVPVYVQGKQGEHLKIYLDVRHGDIKKLEPLSGSAILYSMATEFCKEYLSNTLKANSPKFFGSGALNFDDLVKRRAEIWRLVADAVQTETWGKERHAASPGGFGVPQVVASQDIRRLDVEQGPEEGTEKARILRIVDQSGRLGVDGFYFRLMDGPAKAFGNDIQAMDVSSLFWFGNRLTYVFSDGIETTFHYEIRLQELVRLEGAAATGGVLDLERPIQEIGEGMFLPIPRVLERYLVPSGGTEILVRVNYEWFDEKHGRAFP